MQTSILLCLIAATSAQLLGYPNYGSVNPIYPSFPGTAYGLGAAYPAYGYGLASPAFAAHTVFARDTAAVSEKDATVAAVAVPEWKPSEEKISVIQKRNTVIDVQQRDETENDKTSAVQKKE